MPRRSNRAGFALPTAILVLAVLTMVVAAGFMATTAEISTNTAVRGAGRAYVTAQNGLEQFLARRTDSSWCQHCFLTAPTAPPTADSEWTRVTTSMGYADVMSRRVHVPTSTVDRAIYLLTSLGTDTTLRMSHATSQNAQRMVGLYATWPLPMQLPAAFTALTGLKDSAYTATITGKDACNGGADSVAGITTPINTWVNKINEAPTGKPPFDTLQTQAQVAAETHIDWASIMAGALSANLEIPPSSWPSAGSAQGIALWGDTTNYPVIRIHTNNYTLPAVNNEFGLIICDSNCYNLTNQWKGVILVGGVLTQDHGNTLTGAAVTGLNSLIGGNPGPSLINTQSNAFLYSSCAVASATKRLQPKQVYSPIPNSWTDNIAIY